MFFLRSAGFFDPYFDPYQVASSLEQVDKTAHYTRFAEHIRIIVTVFDGLEAKFSIRIPPSPPQKEIPLPFTGSGIFLCISSAFSFRGLRVRL